MIFLSFGAGVQSSAMLMLAIHGEIERPDHVIFADTGWESRQTLENVGWAARQCANAGIAFHVVSAGNIREDNMIARTAASGEYVRQAMAEHRAGRWVTMPFFVDTGSWTEGRIRRQCTSEYKIAPIRKLQRELLGYAPRQRIPIGHCATMIGISTDEARRASQSKDRWVENLYPLIDPLKMSRADCQKWWEDHYPHRKIGKSSCVGCPYKSDREWARLKSEDPEEWASVIEFDATIRMATGMRGDAYIHRSLKPLDQAELKESQGSFDLEDSVYCAGGCGL